MKRILEITIIFIVVQSSFGWNFLDLFQSKKVLENSKNATDEPLVKEPVIPAGGIIGDRFLTTIELIQKYGYPSEVHRVVTQDGFILEIHRIPKPNGIPVFLQHGLTDSSGGWIIMGPNKSLPYLLSDLGYDVWLGNSRGNRYSRNHTTLDPSMVSFWDFSFHEIGIYDLPSMIDYVLRHSEHDKLHYIGHSQGTTAFWVMCSQKPEYCNRIISMQALAPVAFLRNIQSPIVRQLHLLGHALPIKEIFPHGEYKSINEAICRKQELVKLCAKFIYMFTGEDHYKTNATMLSVILGHWPAGGSTKQLTHFAQLISSGKFRMFDYGVFMNPFKYRKVESPEYDLRKVRAPIVLYMSKWDSYTSIEDVRDLAKELPNVVGQYFITNPEFSHMEFVMGQHNRDTLYKDVIKNMQEIEKKI